MKIATQTGSNQEKIRTPNRVPKLITAGKISKKR